MSFLPVVMREMNVRARRPSTYWGRAAVGLGGVLVMAWMLMASSAAVSTSQQGNAVFVLLLSIGFAFAMLAGVIVTSDCVSEEKREGTLGLLFLTNLKGYDIVLGKLTANSFSAAFALAGFVPILSLAMFLGGVAPRQVAGAALVLATTMFLSLSLGVFVSTLSKNERKAMFAAMVTLAAFTFGPYLLGIFLSGGDNADESATFFSPLYAFLCVYNAGTAAIDPSYFWVSIALQWIAAAGLLAGAALILPRCVNDVASSRFRWIRAVADRFSFGDPRFRKAHRATLLDRNAFLWLASRERTKPRYAWAVIALFAGIYAWIQLRFPELLYEAEVALPIIFLIHLSLKLWTASEVCSRLIQDRRSGALELLLSSPLSVREIAYGQTLALRRIFLRPVIVLIAAEFFLLYRLLEQPRPLVPDEVAAISFLAAISTLLVDLWSIKWVGLWLSVRGKSIERVLIGTVARVLALPWILFALSGGMILASRIFVGQPLRGADLLVLWWFISLATPLAFAIPSRFRFLHRFREAATQRFDTPAERNEVPPAKALKPKERLQRKARRPKLAWALALALAVGVPVLRRFYWSGKFDNEVRRIAAEGYPTGHRNLALYYTPVVAAENSLAELKSAGMVNLNVGPLRQRASVSSTFGLVGVTPMSDTIRRDFTEAIALNQPQLAAFRKALKLPKAYLQPSSEAMWAFPNELHAFAMIAWADAVLASESGDAAAAVERLYELLRYAELAREQPVSEAQTVCDGALRRATHVTERLLYQHDLPVETLAEIQRRVTKVDRDILSKSLIVRRALVLSRLGAPAQNPMGGPPNTAVVALSGVWSAIGSTDKSYTKLLDAYRKGIEAAKIAAPERLKIASQLDREGANNLLDVPSYLSAPYEMSGVFRFDAMITARIRVLQAGLAAARYRKPKGEAPPSLESLVPEFLEAVPLDPFDGSRLKTKLERNELRIYSGREHGGRRANYFNEDAFFSLWKRPSD